MPKCTVASLFIWCGQKLAVIFRGVGQGTCVIHLCPCGGSLRSCLTVVVPVVEKTWRDSGKSVFIWVSPYSVAERLNVMGGCRRVYCNYQKMHPEPYSTRKGLLEEPGVLEGLSGGPIRKPGACCGSRRP